MLSSSLFSRGSLVPRQAAKATTILASALCIQQKFLASSSTFLSAPTRVLLSNRKNTSGGGIGFDERDVPVDRLRSPIWDRDDVDTFEQMEEDGFLMSEDDAMFMESLKLLSDEELELLQRDALDADKKQTKK